MKTLRGEGCPCLKCGYQGLVHMWWTAARPAGIFRAGAPERIRRMCMRCDGVWYEAPLDAEAEPDGKVKRVDPSGPGGFVREYEEVD